MVKEDLKNDPNQERGSCPNHFEVRIDGNFTFVKYASTKGYDYYIFNFDQGNVLLSIINMGNYGWELWKRRKTSFGF